jgi:CBS domain-containing protein
MDSTTLRSPMTILNPARPISVQHGTRLSEVLKVMKENRIGCVCVVDNRQLVGILTERDILNKVVGGNLDLQGVRVEEVMTPNPEYLFEDDQLAFALNRMSVGGFRHIPLINLQGHPTAVISVKDIVAHLVKNLGDIH